MYYHQPLSKFLATVSKDVITFCTPCKCLGNETDTSLYITVFLYGTSLSVALFQENLWGKYQWRITYCVT